ncbi:hypothetical protein HNR65_001374 [Desulfosalsimonas propionicica]|uniref:YtkA-like domain-containing protein n=1 Tax=Desulfosalsimonas propionicica TaxID=332175 RepID=A0A7W0C8D0_9BACT|nr:hypothetical protein [Desulfosalsimonas propionicica]MBA2881048.1 hypothetical protein [Desulfosalsimonas propionicica]
MDPASNRCLAMARVALGAAIFLALAAAAAPALAQNPEVRTTCNIHQGPCSAELAGRNVELDISPKPVKAMEELEFRVTISGDRLSAAPYIDLGMPAMKMGPNRVEMVQQKENTWTGKGVIVRCPSGKTTWFARVTLPETGTAEFVFDVVY